jgi:hypothetical protein
VKIMENNAKWTYMVFMAGDNSLSTNVDDDLEEMRKVGSSPNVNVLAQFDKAGLESSKRFRVQPGGIDEKVEELGETDSGDPKVLEDFIAWSYDNYPADRYALILWNHGGGWEPDPSDEPARHGRLLKRPLFGTTINKIVNLGSSKERAICIDDGTCHALDTIELGNVLEYAKTKIGQKLDILGMDACLMSNFEVAYQAEPYVNYIVGSEESEPKAGWQYSAILDRLNKNPDISTPEFCSEMVNFYTESYKESDELVTQSAFDLSKVKDVAKSLDSLGEALKDKMFDEEKNISNAQFDSTSFFYLTLWDASNFCKVLSGLTQDNSVKQAAQNVIKEFEPGSEKFIIAESHIGEAYDQCCGASVYLIPRSQRISPYYADLEFAKDCENWLAMLKKYHNVS